MEPRSPSSTPLSSVSTAKWPLLVPVPCVQPEARFWSNVTTAEALLTNDVKPSAVPRAIKPNDENRMIAPKLLLVVFLLRYILLILVNLRLGITARYMHYPLE